MNQLEQTKEEQPKQFDQTKCRECGSVGTIDIVHGSNFMNEKYQYAVCSECQSAWWL